jgi:hypothetical protein
MRNTTLIQFPHLKVNLLPAGLRFFAQPTLPATLWAKRIPVIENQVGMRLLDYQVWMNRADESVGAHSCNVVGPSIPSLAIAPLESKPASELTVKDGQRLFGKIPDSHSHRVSSIFGAQLSVNAQATFAVNKPGEVAIVEPHPLIIIQKTKPVLSYS